MSQFYNHYFTTYFKYLILFKLSRQYLFVI